MVYVTYITKTHICPKWNIDVSIEAKYIFADKESPYIANFISCKCPLMENLKKPIKNVTKTFLYINLVEQKKSA